MKTVFGLNVEKAHLRNKDRREPEENLGPEAALMAELKQLLPYDACAFAGAAAPHGERQMIVICHRGRALGLQLVPRDSKLSHAETNSFIAMRSAGMRIEVARDGSQAKALIREMGVPLREEARHELRDVFRDAVRRR